MLFFVTHDCKVSIFGFLSFDFDKTRNLKTSSLALTTYKIQLINQ